MSGIRYAQIQKLKQLAKEHHANVFGSVYPMPNEHLTVMEEVHRIRMLLFVVLRVCPEEHSG